LRIFRGTGKDPSQFKVTSIIEKTDIRW